MNDTTIRITRLSGPLPPEPVIPAATLAGYFDAASIVERAHEQARALLHEAGQTLQAAHDEAVRIRARARAEGIADADAAREHQRRTLIEETVQWCVDEAALEQAVAERVEARIVELVARLLGEFFHEQDPTALLMRRIRAQLPRWLSDGRLTMHVSPDAHEAAIDALTGMADVEVLADRSLANTQAVLHTPFVNVRFDIDAHLRSLLDRLGAPDRHQEPS